MISDNAEVPVHFHFDCMIRWELVSMRVNFVKSSHPLNHWKDSIGYGCAVYFLIGIGVPLMVTIVCNKISVARRLLGLPKINIKSL